MLLEQQGCSRRDAEPGLRSWGCSASSPPLCFYSSFSLFQVAPAPAGTTANVKTANARRAKKVRWPLSPRRSETLVCFFFPPHICRHTKSSQAQESPSQTSVSSSYFFFFFCPKRGRWLPHKQYRAPRVTQKTACPSLASEAQRQAMSLGGRDTGTATSSVCSRPTHPGQKGAGGALRG